jgi:hypothetical protein
MSFRLVLVFAIGFVLLTAGSIYYRLQKAKPILKPVFDEVIFVDTWCSGQSDRRFQSRLARAPGFLWVVVTRDHLYVSPQYPFNLWFAAELFGWDHRVPGKAILDVRSTNSPSSTAEVAIRYRHRTGDEETLRLVVTDSVAFRKALAHIREKFD